MNGNNNTNHKAIPSALFISVIMVTDAQADTTSTNFLVTATVLTSCSVTATPLVFGNYDPIAGTTLNAANTIVVNCTTGTAYNVGLDAGTGSGATVTTRKMTSGVNTLNYTLYQDFARTNVWGNTPPTNTVNATAGVLPTTHTIYGRVFSGQNPPASLYSDTITVTVTY